MRVLLDCRMASWSGIGRYTTGLARALAARDDVQLVQVCAAGEAPPVGRGAGVEVVAASAHPFGLRGALEFARLASNASPDLVHCAHFPTPLPATHPLVVSLHDLIPLILPSTMPSHARRAIYRAWNARAVHVADRVLANSRHTASDIARRFAAAGPKLRVVLLSAEGLADGPVTAMPGGLLPAGAVYLLSMGNTKPHKDLPTLLRAFARVVPARPELRLLLVGADVPGFVTSVLAGDEAAGRVRFTGRVGDDVLRALYRDAAAFVFPSRYEGFGLPPLEAMACGCPVVCSDAASLPEVVGDAALLFPAGDAGALAASLSRVLDDPALCQERSRAGRARAAQFTWERTAAETVAVYREALQLQTVRSGTSV
jgi:glycosyltransferase involved in cell wall biosynthesis